jgi:hypothetical protein
MTSQEAYFADANAFGDLAQLQAASNFGLSPGNTGTVVTGVSGYTATIENPSILTGITQCTVEYGNGAPVGTDGVMICN